MKTFVILFVTLLSFHSALSMNVLGIDLGSSFIKAQLISPGKPFSIVENLASKRKTETSITFTPDGRVYGPDSFMQRAGAPLNSFSYFLDYLGRPFNADLPKSRLSANKVKADPARGNNHFLFEMPPVSPSSTHRATNASHTFGTEELLAMLLAHVRDLAEKQLKDGKVKDAVITIPAYYTQAQRKAVRDAARLAGINVIGLVHENNAAAIAYGIDRMDVNKTHTALFYNMGASKTQVSVVRYSAVKPKYGAAVEAIEVLGEGWEEHLGGRDLDQVVVDFLIKEYGNLSNKNIPEAKRGENIRKEPKVMERLLKQAVKIKEVLSANKHTPVIVQDFISGVDLHTKLTREQFEELAAPFLKRAVRPVEMALKQAGIAADVIDQVEIVGGGVRVPAVKALLAKFLNVKELGTHLNGDESMSFGAAFMAANYSSIYRVRKILLTATPALSMRLRVSNLNKTAAGDKFHKSSMIFKAVDRFDSRRSVTFSHKEDLRLTLSSIVKPGVGEISDSLKKYIGNETAGWALENEEDLYVFNVAGISALKEDDKYKKLGTPKVILTFQLTRSGLYGIKKAEAMLVERIVIEDPVIVNATNSTGNGTNNGTTNGTGAGKPSNSESAPNATNGTNTTEPKKIKTYKQTHRIPLEVTIEFRPRVGILSEEQKNNISVNIAMFEDFDNEKLLTIEAKNNFETRIYALKDYLREDKWEPFSTSAEKESYMKMLNDEEEWLYDAGFDATKEKFNEKVGEIDGKMANVSLRIKEHTARELEVPKHLVKLNETYKTLAKLNDSKPWIAESNAMNNTMDELRSVTEFIKNKTEAQSKLKPHENPVFKVQEISDKLMTLKFYIDMVRSTPKPDDWDKKQRLKRKKERKARRRANRNGTANSNSTSNASKDSNSTTNHTKVEL